MESSEAFEPSRAVLDFRRSPPPRANGPRLQDAAATGRVRTACFASVFIPRRAQGVAMPPLYGRSSTQSEGKLSIGALSRATGIPVETLRTLEARYGFPIPERKPSGHRVYPLTSIPRLHRIAEALSRGHRAGEVVAASDEALKDILAATGVPAPDARPVMGASGNSSDLLKAVETFDAANLTRLLFQDWARLGPLDFLRTLLSPAIREVGDAWERGQLEIRHEHFFSERVGDLLRSLRLPFEERAVGSLVVCASLPGESHSLGLQMAALVLAIVGCRVLFLGTDVPVAQVASLAKDLGARAVAVSVSQASRGAAMTNQVSHLRRLLPRRVSLVVGGDGAPRRRTGIETIQDFVGLDAWGRRLTAAV